MDNPRDPVRAAERRPGIPDDLDALLVGLTTAAHSLALSRFTAAPGLSGGPHTICSECRRIQRPHDVSLHGLTCHTGQVFAAIRALEDYFEAQRLLPSAADLDRMAEEIDAAVATSVPRSRDDQADGFRDYGEPWRNVSDKYETVETRDGRLVVEMTGSELVEEDDIEYARRIRACVNFCADMPTEAIEGCRLTDFREPVTPMGGKLLVLPPYGAGTIGGNAAFADVPPAVAVAGILQDAAEAQEGGAQ